MVKSFRVMIVTTLLLMIVFPHFIAAQDEDTPTGELVIALPNDPTSLYGPNAADITADNAAFPLYDSLVSINQEGQLVPSLAESWTINEDGTVYTFLLRQDVTFHNGEPFNADSVIATWEFGKTETNQFADSFEPVIAIEALDEFTVRMTTTAPESLLLIDMADNWWMIPPIYMNEVGIDAFSLAPVGTGPFMFVERFSEDRIVYEANPNYWQEGVPMIERVVFRIIPNSTRRLELLRAGEVDIINRLSFDDAAQLERDEDINLISYPNDRVYYVGFKNIGDDGDTPLTNIQVRQALNLAVNRQAIIDEIFGGEAQAISGFTIPSNLGFDNSITPFTYDPEQAQALLTEAGYEDGFEISLGCPTDAYPNINAVCFAIQRDLAEIGVEVAVEFRTTNSFWAEPSYGNVGPMYVDSWGSAVGEALPRLEGALTPGNYYNTWDDETLITYLEQLSSTINRDDRAALYGEVQQYMIDNPPFLYLYTLNVFEAASNRVDGYNPRANERYDLRTVSVSDE